MGAECSRFYGDILGDWREEVIYVADDQNSLLFHRHRSFTRQNLHSSPQSRIQELYDIQRYYQIWLTLPATG